MKNERKEELKWIIGRNYTKIELVQNVWVEEDGKIGAQLAELKLEELDRYDDGFAYNLVVTDEFNFKTIFEYIHSAPPRKIRTYDEENHFRLFPTLYVLRNKEFY